jgi:hypothetical protein
MPKRWHIRPHDRAAVASLDPARVALGDGIKRPYAEEMPALAKQGKPTFVIA